MTPDELNTIWAKYIVINHEPNEDGAWINNRCNKPICSICSARSKGDAVEALVSGVANADKLDIEHGIVRWPLSQETISAWIWWEMGGKEEWDAKA